MTIQNIFYICGIIVFILASLLVLTMLLTVTKLSRKSQDLMDTIENKMESSFVSAMSSILPIVGAIFTEIMATKTYKRRKRKK
ncbi:hypothetical protein ACFL1M_02975 [Patescibacteria group bacterium]